MSPFGLSTINEITWDNFTKCIELFQIKNLNEDDLFNEFTEIQSVFKFIQNKNISLYDQVQSYIGKISNSNIYATTSTTISLGKVAEIVEDNDDSNEDSIVSKEIRPDHLWAMLLSIKPSPNLHRFISFLFSIPCSNAYVESVFSIMKHLYGDQRNRMSTDLIAAELKIRLNASFPCTQIYDFFYQNRIY